MECLLPSEIARLVFGYLEEQKCDEAANIFLEHSPYLSECLNVARAGKKFSSRVHGSSLLDVLDEYCAVQSLVAEKIRKLPENTSEQLRTCGGLVEKLKVLLDSAKSGQTVAVSISVLPHSGTTPNNSSTGTTHNRSKAALTVHERKRSIRFQGQENKLRVKEREDRNVSIECSVETTQLDTLPGLSGQDSRSTQTSVVHSLTHSNELGLHHAENITIRRSSDEHFYSSGVDEQFSSEKGRSHSFSSTSSVPDKDAVQEANLTSCETGASLNTTPKRKSKKKCSSFKVTQLRVRKQTQDDEEEYEEEEEEESVAATLHRALLNNKALHEKIAENINSVIRIPNEAGSTEVPCGPVGPEDCENVIHELNNAIKMVVDKTQEDPVFERLLEEIIGPTDEDMSSSPTGIESETDDGCEPPDALMCNEKIVSSKEGDIAEQNPKTAIHSEQKNQLDSSVVHEADISVTGLQTSCTPDHCDGISFDTVIADENIIHSKPKSLRTSNKSSKSLVEKSSRKNVSGPLTNQGKIKLSSPNTVQTQDTPCSVRAKKEIKGLLDLPENFSSEIVGTPKNDIPLKQRLRSARKSDSVTQGSSKEISSVDRSLEDQNAKAIQLILEANRKSALLREKELVCNASNELLTENSNPKTVPTSSKKAPDVTDSSSEHQKNGVGDENANELTQSSTCIPEERHDDELDDNVNTSEELHDTFPSNDISDQSVVESNLVEANCDVVTESHVETHVETHVEKDQVMMVTIPSVLNSDSSVSTVIAQTQAQPVTMQEVISEGHISELQSSQFSIMTLSQSVADTQIVTSKPQLLMDEMNSSVIVCDSNVTIPSIFSQYLKDTKGNQVKKMRPIAPRPIRPKPTTLPVQLFSSDMSPQYFVSQVPPAPSFERKNIATTTTTQSSSGFLNVLNLTLPVISQPNEPSKMICICTPGTSGKKCSEEHETDSTGDANVESCGDSEISIVSEQIPNAAKDLNTIEINRIHPGSLVVCKENCMCENTSTEIKLQVQQNTSTGSKINDKEVLDMSSLLILPEKISKPRETPQAFIAGKSCINSRRLSLSTPRRRTSHIRTLDFGTPLKSGTESIAQKKSQTSPKPSSKGNAETTVPRVEFSVSPYKLINNQVRNVRSSLFTSPDPPSENKDERKSNKGNSSNSQAIPIATRSPVTHLMGDWDKATGVGLIFNGISPESVVVRSVENRQTRLTPKTLLFSPESENSSPKDPNQKSPSNKNTCDPGMSIAKNLNNSSSSEHEISLRDSGATNNDSSSSSQKGSQSTMPIKQKLKSRSWDEDLRNILSQDYRDVYVQNENENETEVPDKMSADINSSNNQSTKKLKRKYRRKGPGRNENSLSVDEQGKQNSSNAENKNSRLFKTPNQMKARDLKNCQGSVMISSAKTKESLESQRKTDTNVEIQRPVFSMPDVSSADPNTCISRKRKADNVNEGCLSKQPKLSTESEKTAGKTVEEVLETMFCEEKGSELSKETVSKTTSDLLTCLSASPVSGMVSSGLTVKKNNSNEGEMKRREVEENKLIPTRSNQLFVSVIGNDQVMENNFLSNIIVVSSEAPKSSEKSCEKQNMNNSVSASQKGESSCGKNADLETPVKNDVKNLFKTFNPMTPGPIDHLFPMTPRVLSPSHQEDTPITKLLRGEPCINFSMIVTPSLPPTPNIIISPNSENEDSPTSYASRPTDYSSCSSYYNPSKAIDTPTKLEQEIIKECSMIEQNNKEKISKSTSSGETPINYTVNVNSPGDSLKSRKLVENEESLKELQPQSNTITRSSVCVNSLVETTSDLSNRILEECTLKDTEVGRKAQQPDSTEEKQNTSGNDAVVRRKVDSASNSGRCPILVITEKNVNYESMPAENDEIDKPGITHKKNHNVEKVSEESPQCLEENRVSEVNKRNDQDLKEIESSTIKESSILCLKTTSQNSFEKEMELGAENHIAGIDEVTNSNKVQSSTKKRKVTKGGKVESDMNNSKERKEMSDYSQNISVVENKKLEHHDNKKDKENTIDANENINKATPMNNRPSSKASSKKDTIIDKSVAKLRSKTTSPRASPRKGSSNCTADGKSTRSRSKQISNKKPYGRKYVDNLLANTKVVISTKKHPAGMMFKNEKGQKSKIITEKLRKKNVSENKNYVSENPSESPNESCTPLIKENIEEKKGNTGSEDINVYPSTSKGKRGNRPLSYLHITNNGSKMNKMRANEHKVTDIQTTKSSRKPLEKDCDSNKKSSGVSSKTNESFSLQKLAPKQVEDCNLSSTKVNQSKQKGMFTKTSSEFQTKKKCDKNEKEIIHSETSELIHMKNYPDIEDIIPLSILRRTFASEREVQKNKEENANDVEVSCSKNEGKKTMGKIKDSASDMQQKIEKDICLKNNKEGMMNNDPKEIDIGQNKPDENIKEKYVEKIDDVGVQNENVSINQENIDVASMGKNGEDTLTMKKDIENKKIKDADQTEDNVSITAHTSDDSLRDPKTIDSIETNTQNIGSKSEGEELSEKTSALSADYEYTELEQKSIENESVKSVHFNASERNIHEIHASDALESISTHLTFSENIPGASKISVDSTDEQIPKNTLHQTEGISVDQMDPEISGEKSSSEDHTDSSSSESDSDDSSDDSCSDSSDDSSNESSPSNMSSEVDDVNNDSVLPDDHKSLEIVPVDNTSDQSDEKIVNNKRETILTLKEHSGSEMINEILKNVSSITHVHEEKCFALELDEKKKRTLARLKGTEIEEIGKAFNDTSEEQRCPTPKEGNCEKESEVVLDKNWEESSIEEFPVLHLSDSESVGNVTPYVSPTKSPFISSVFERHKYDTRKCELSNLKTIHENNDPSAKSIEDLLCANKSKTADSSVLQSDNILEKESTDINQDNISKVCGNNDNSKENQNLTEVHESCDGIKRMELEAKRNTSSLECENINLGNGDNSDHPWNTKHTKVVNILRMDENELFLTLHYTGDVCPTPQVIAYTNFSYSLGEDDEEITITGSSFQNLMELPSKDECDKPNCKKHLKETQEENRSLLNTSFSSRRGDLKEMELDDSNSESTRTTEESDTQSKETSYKMRPLDLLYEEMMKSNDSSSTSDDPDNSFSEKRKLLSNIKSTKKKIPSGGKPEQKSLKRLGSKVQTSRESVRYQSPLEMISEYNIQKDVRNLNSRSKGELKMKDKNSAGKDSISPEEKERSEELEEGEILDSPVKEKFSRAGSRKSGESSTHVFRRSRRSDSSESSVHSFSFHKSKARSSDVMKRENTAQYQKDKKCSTSASSTHHDDVRSLPPKKRKAVSDDTAGEPEKRAHHDNPCKLLKNLNIDSFLNKVHGEDTSK